MEIIKGGVVVLSVLFAIMLLGLGVGSAKKKDMPAATGLFVMALTNFAAAGFIAF